MNLNNKIIKKKKKRKNKHGGYRFSAPVVPSSFNAGGPAPGMN